MDQPFRVPRGLAGVAVTESRIAKSGADGSLVYRGYPIQELASNATFEETAYLVLKGALPSRGELDAFSQGLKSRMDVGGKVLGILRELGGEAHPIDALRTAVSALGSIDGLREVEDQETSIEAKMAVLAANCHRLPQGLGPRAPRHDLGFASNLLFMMTGKVVDGYDLWAFERVLLFYMEHDLNASSFTVRVVASTLADPYAAASAGLASLKGPLHGGANEGAMKLILDVGSPEKAKQYVGGMLERKEKVIGFGHRVYKKFDPRAVLCKEYLKEMCLRRGDTSLFELCEAIESEVVGRKGIPANLDYYAAPIFYLLGIEVPLFTPIFAASRVFGWMAHYNEQVAENKLIRPDATYVGPSELKYVPIDRR